MGGEGVGRAVGQAARERRGADVAAGPEGGVGGPRRRDERAEEGHPRRVGAHRVEVGAHAPGRRHRHVREQVRRGRAGHEVVAGDARAVPGRRARQVREQPPVVPVPREGLPRDARQPRPSRDREQRQAVSRHDVGGGLREPRRLVGGPLVGERNTPLRPPSESPATPPSRSRTLWRERRLAPATRPAPATDADPPAIPPDSSRTASCARTGGIPALPSSRIIVCSATCRRQARGCRQARAAGQGISLREVPVG